MNSPVKPTASDGPPQAAEVGPERRAAVDQAREGWIRRLIDLSRRNNLLYFRDLKLGSLDLSDHDTEAMAALLGGETVPLNRLLPRADEVRAAAQVLEIRRRALANWEEKGLETLFLALGMATWAPADEGRPPQSAVLLVPMAVEARGREGRAVALRRAGEEQVNPVLLHVLETEHGRTVAPESLLPPINGEEEGERFDPEEVFTRLARAANGIKGFAVNRRAVMSNFSFQKMAMVKDLRERGAEMASHDLIAAIAGNAAARETVSSRRTGTDPREFDRVPPDTEFLILDADSSQQKVIAAVLAGQDGAIHGPPGTGKSQTIANLIAALAAEGRRILFVAEKRAALEVVQRRLEAVGLGHLALDLHGADISRREVMQRIRESLDVVRESAAVDVTEVHRRFADRRARLNEHVARLHARRAPSGMSAYELQGRLLRLPPEARASTRWRGPDLDRLNAETTAAVRDLLVEAGGFGGLFLRIDPSPWTGATLADGRAVQQAVDLAARLARERWPALRSSLADLVAETGLAAPATLEGAKGFVLLLQEVCGTLALYDVDLFRQDLDVLVAALAPASRGRLAEAWAWCTNAPFRAARWTLRSLRRERSVPARQLHDEAAAAADQLRRWRTCSSAASIPCRVPGLEVAGAHLEALLGDLGALAPCLGRGDLGRLPLDKLGGLLDALAADAETPYRLPRLREIERALDEAGAGPIVAELRDRKPEPRLWPQVFEHAWLASSLDRTRSESPALAGFDGRTHDRFVDEFRRLDRERLELAVARVRRAHAERAVAARNAFPEQDALVRREAAKKTRHLPLRKLLAEAPDVLTALRPCWMASPLSVSQLLGADRRYFDVVLFDEASQVLPEDAVPALLRASRAVVAGDRHQLPPTTFFAAGEDEEDEEEVPGAATGFESVLDLMQGFLDPWPLDWHYRSRDEALIAFSNRHIYGERLVTFPGPGGPLSLSYVLVPHVPGQEGQEESASEEIRRVVELVLEHASTRPSETLGVIAMGIKHARRVEAAIEEARRLRPDFDAFLDQTLEERFFVKNLERVQGDERDAIILTVGYGKDRAGRLLYRFGPLLYEGGERRLNVAITRARHHVTLVSSFDHHDMDPSRSKARGVELLRLYIEYAASGGQRLGDAGRTAVPLNTFEQDVYDALTARGLSLEPQWGASCYRIDLVAKHPRRPGRFVLAVECDGASYHSAYTARDRDRLRQQHLEALGWCFHRIWSTDWFLHRDQEIDRALAAFEAAAARADRVDGEPNDGSGSSPGAEAPSQNRAPSRGVLVGQRRGPRPAVPRRSTIDEYSQGELVALVTWLCSDGRLRTDDEIVEEMVRELGFQRRGARIEAAIRRVIERVRSTPGRT